MKSVEELTKEIGAANSLIVDSLEWIKGCEALFGKTIENNLELDKAIRDVGREKIVEESLWSCCCRTDKGFSHWVSDKINYSRLPEYLSKQAFIDEFYEELTDLYNKEIAYEKAEHKDA